MVLKIYVYLSVDENYCNYTAIRINLRFVIGTLRNTLLMTDEFIRVYYFKYR